MSSRKKRGFTLIELLVVIAIIAILAAILFPVFMHAKQTARTRACASNLRQWGMALIRYTDDNNGRYPYAGPCGGGAAHKMSPPPIGQGGGSPAAYQALAPYAGKGEGLKHCLEFDRIYPQAWTSSLGWSYWYMCNHNNPHTKPAASLCGYTTSSVTFPSRKPAIVETAPIHGCTISPTTGQPVGGGYWNASFCDGHMVTRKFSNYQECIDAFAVGRDGR